ncbi:MAG: Flp pilus assembly protein CpaB [Chloroflexi bacterium]|nr:Flp pilus assembly protein CpaB [Chloroflexota bacterium]
MRRRAGLLLMLVGLMLASMSALLVLGMARQTQETAQQVRQVYVVMLTRDVSENTSLTADMLAVKPFPADFAPGGAVATVEEAIGKLSSMALFKDTVLLRSQLGGAKKARDVSAILPPGKVAFWLPMPELLSSTGGVKSGDHLDILLTVNLCVLKPDGTQSCDSDKRNNTTQTTLQNVEVFMVGSVADLEKQNIGATSVQGMQDVAAARRAISNQAAQAIVVLVDHQDAVIVKFVKDSGGTIDLVLRATEDTQVVRTDGMTLDSIFDRFRFRVPQTPQR